MSKLKDQVLREFGDEGADTLERYFAQIEYTALWCIRMLDAAERISVVIPEAVEDLVVVRSHVRELHQVKTRSESQGPWTTADVLPIICQQYHRRGAFPGECHFHFVSDQMADTKTMLRESPPAYGALYRVKFLLAVEHDGQVLSADELQELKRFEKILIPKIQSILLDKYNERVDTNTAQQLLHRTWIDTDCALMRNPNNLMDLGNALSELYPGGPSHTTVQLRDIYGRLLLLVLRKILTGTSLQEREITSQEVIDCQSHPLSPEEGYPDLDKVSGQTTLDKKARLGGFDPTEIPVFHRQQRLAEWDVRRLETLGFDEDLYRLTTALIDLQRTCRHDVCRKQGIEQNPGPAILEAVCHNDLAQVASKYLPGPHTVDEQFCLGVLWAQTNLCSVWWHHLNSE